MQSRNQQKVSEDFADLRSPYNKAFDPTYHHRFPWNSSISYYKMLASTFMKTPKPKSHSKYTCKLEQATDSNKPNENSHTTCKISTLTSVFRTNHTYNLTCKHHNKHAREAMDSTCLKEEQTAMNDGVRTADERRAHGGTSLSAPPPLSSSRFLSSAQALSLAHLSLWTEMKQVTGHFSLLTPFISPKAHDLQWLTHLMTNQCMLFLWPLVIFIFFLNFEWAWA